MHLCWRCMLSLCRRCRGRRRSLGQERRSGQRRGCVGSEGARSAVYISRWKDVGASGSGVRGDGLGSAAVDEDKDDEVMELGGI